MARRRRWPSALGRTRVRRLVRLVALVALAVVVVAPTPAAGPAWGAAATAPSGRSSAVTSVSGKASPAKAPATESKPTELPAAVPPKTSDLELLLKTIEDPVARDTFIRQLRAALERERQATAGEATPLRLEGIRFVRIYEDFIAAFQGQLRRVTSDLRQFPRLVRRGVVEFSSRAVLVRLVDFLWKAGVAVAGALLLAWLLGRPARHVRRRLSAPGEPRRFAGKLVGGLTRGALDLLALGVFVLAVFAALSLLRAAPQGAAILLALLWALFLRRLIMVGGTLLFSAEQPELRFLPLSDEGALYWTIWLRRLSGYGVYGYYGVVILRGLGLPAHWANGLLVLYGAGLVLLFITIILQQRREVRDLLMPKEEPSLPAWRTVLLLWNLISVRWDLIAIIYLVLAYALWALNYPHALTLLLRASVLTLLLACLCLLARHFLTRLLGKLFTIRDGVGRRFPGIEQRVNRYIRLLNGIVFTILYVIVAILVFEAWGVDLLGFFFSDLGIRLVLQVFTIALTLAIAAVVIEAANFVVDAVLQPRQRPSGETVEPSQKIKTLAPLARTTLKWSVLGLTLLILMEQVGISITPILAGIGVLGLAVGFGAQTLVKDIITGLFILLEDSVRVGDVVILKGTGGLVENVNLRTIRIRDLAGSVHVIPHSSVEMVTNMTKDFSRYVLDIGVAYRENTDEVVEILKEIGAEMQKDPVYGPDMLEPLEIMGVDRFADSAVIIRARLTTKPIKQWNVGREFNRRMKKVFDERGIEIPFPHQTLYFGQPKEGMPPPLYMEQVSRGFAERTAASGRAAGHARQATAPEADQQEKT
ncbi:MAG: mechanosensitive ion channel [Candidatus Tectomicrobia bacterium]|nr:mechanosensitive ion channel [Candidatus Tectomicrobia bacterium]